MMSAMTSASSPAASLSAPRRVTASHDGAGNAVVSKDAPPPRTIDVEGGPGVAELVWLDGPVHSVDDACDREGEGFPLEPPPGGASLRIIRLPAPAAGTPVDQTWLRVHGGRRAEWCTCE